MDTSWENPFSKDEIAAARAAFRDEETLLARVREKIRRLARQLPFTVDLLAAFHCVRDPATPPRVRWILLLALGYFVMPMDTVPDFIPLLGFTDDAAVLATAIATVRGALRPDHYERARETLNGQEI